MGKDLIGKELGKGFTQRKDGVIKHAYHLEEERNRYAYMVIL